MRKILVGFESQIAADTELSVQKGYLLMMLNRLNEAKAYYLGAKILERQEIWPTVSDK